MMRQRSLDQFQIGRAGLRPRRERIGVLARRFTILLPAMLLLAATGATAGQSETGGGAPQAGHSTVPAKTCLLCHSHGPGPKVDVPGFAHSVHAELPCASCHRDVVSIPHSLRLAPVNCGVCHAAVAAEYAKGIHGMLRANGLKTAPTCTTCHGTHEVHNVRSKAFLQAMPKRCADCHRKAYVSYRATFHGQAAQLGMRSAATCWNCHRPHRTLPPNNPDSKVAAANLVTTCGQCHSGVNRNFVQFDVHPDPSDPGRSLPVYWAHAFYMGGKYMIGLLAFVFGFFGLHTILWLQRIAVGMFRGEIARPGKDTQYVIRFNLVARLTHITVLVSFMLLALTGLPLLYHDARWAQFISVLFGGEGVSRIIHRVCGVITFGYLFFHIGYLTYLVLRRKKHGVFYGADSMVPRRKDLVDLFRNFRWFLYLGPRPALDRWTYWEKFDYWGVVWGVVLMGLSGLAIWLLGPFTQILSGAYLNVAWVVHGKEALLAIGFIFVFHFFHNHLRPENFPIDVTIFTGRLPLSRFREERPELYQRLVRDGRLDQVLVPPPSSVVTVAWKIFGYAVVVVGVALIISVIVAMLR